jgi:stearoyl-CoA desaturase (delta-9 desaturase)
MAYAVVCALTFTAAYALNCLYMTVFYHRALTHGAVRLSPWAKRFVVATGVWVTGLDPKSWCCMHRLHHLHSDTEADPHSPMRFGVAGVFRAQLLHYIWTMQGLDRGLRRYQTIAADLDFPVDWVNRKRLWFFPHFVHLAIAIGIGVAFHAWLAGLCFFVGLLCAPLGGWAVNAFGHSRGYRNFETPDNSRNNTAVALLVCGEGYQNNHHADPTRASFAVTPGEFDWGFALCRAARLAGLIESGEHWSGYAAGSVKD